MRVTITQSVSRYTEDVIDTRIDPADVGYEMVPGAVILDCDAETAIAIGRITGSLWMIDDGYFIRRGDCRRFAELVTDLREYDQDQITTARDQIDDAGFGDVFSDNEIAWLDYSMRRQLADAASCVDDPWSGSVSLSITPSAFMRHYLQRREALQRRMK